MRRLFLSGFLLACLGLVAIILYRTWPWPVVAGGTAAAWRVVYGSKRAKRKSGHPWLAAGAGFAAGALMPASWHEKRQERTGFQDWTCGYCGALIPKPLKRRYCNPHCAHNAKLAREGKEIYDPKTSEIPF